MKQQLLALAFLAACRITKAEFRAGGAWGRAVPLNLRIAAFPVREQIP